ncbi:hypothetical protein Mapa_002173 [Marchantia paleacea]|nr:hypothetical protein Mapa_002173 [Marchantia paleacea]
MFSNVPRAPSPRTEASQRCQSAPIRASYSAFCCLPWLASFPLDGWKDHGQQQAYLSTIHGTQNRTDMNHWSLTSPAPRDPVPVYPSAALILLSLFSAF